MSRQQLVRIYLYSKVGGALPLGFANSSICSPDILKEYRRLDDTIIMRLNRANAAMRDQDRIHGLREGSSLQDGACEYIWRQLVGEFSIL
jgi:ABC-type phosphate/phosphonate transport system ATPase subunit